jgi:chorismate mutase
MGLQGVRGAIDVSDDIPELMLGATRQLLQAICSANPELRPSNLASVIFSTTSDLKSVYPAQAAREIGWTRVPLLCLQEMQVAGAMPRVIRVLIHWNTSQAQESINHVYLGNTSRLRVDIAGR